MGSQMKGICIPFVCMILVAFVTCEHNVTKRSSWKTRDDSSKMVKALNRYVRKEMLEHIPSEMESIREKYETSSNQCSVEIKKAIKECKQCQEKEQELEHNPCVFLLKQVIEYGTWYFKTLIQPYLEAGKLVIDIAGKLKDTLGDLGKDSVKFLNDLGKFSEKLGNDLLKGGGEVVQNSVDALKKVGEDLVKLGDDVAKEVGKGVEDITKGLGNSLDNLGKETRNLIKGINDVTKDIEKGVQHVTTQVFTTMALSKVPDVKVNFTTCPICSEIFKSPKILPCLHTFCQTCIHQVVLSANHKKDSQTISAFSCPICRTVVNPRTDNKEAINIDKWAAELPDNISMDTMITFTQSNKKQECHACKRHEQTTEAKFWCKQCFEAFCEKCNSMHSWMKMLATHQVVLIDEFISQIDGIDLKAIEEQCRTHPLNMIDVFCYDHRAMCCSLCVSLDHRKCENIKSIDEITTCNDIFYGSLLEKIEHIKVATEENLQTNHQEKETLRVGVEKTEDEASKFVDHIKRRLDNLFETFQKQLHMSRDEQNTKLNVRIRLLEQLVRNLEHWIKVTKRVKDDGSKTQLFMHVETIKHQIETSIKEITNINYDTTITGVYFVKNEKFQEVEGIDQIGSLKHIESVIGSELGNVYEACQDFGIHCPINLEDIRIKKVRTIHILCSNLKCGVCFKDKYILLGDKVTVHLVDKSKGLVVKSFAVGEIIKRFCLDLKHERLFLSCHNTSLFYADFVGEAINPPKKMKFSNHGKSFGALFYVEGDVYVVTNGAIQEISSHDLSPATNLTECFKTNTYSGDIAGHNGLTFFNEQIYYTTTAKEVKCSTLEGLQIFSHKSDQIKMPVSVAMWQFGITAAFILNREPRGSLHALSVDGKKEVQLLGKFENVTDPWDMWVDIDEKEIYVAGGEYIDVYRVKFKSE